VDEVGRGPLAGSVVAAAVILPADFQVLGVDDSKKLSPRRREEIYCQISENAVAIGLGEVGPQTIDRINILEATRLAMEGALVDLAGRLAERWPGEKIEHVLVDALHLKNCPLPQTTLIKGDAVCLSIAAASIVAKVTRDRQMVRFHECYPDYGFDRNKGYGTKAHYEGLARVGPCPIHRRSFLKGWLKAGESPEP
jgi:ribonuclease HII